MNETPQIAEVPNEVWLDLQLAGTQVRESDQITFMDVPVEYHTLMAHLDGNNLTMYMVTKKNGLTAFDPRAHALTAARNMLPVVVSAFETLFTAHKVTFRPEAEGLLLIGTTQQERTIAILVEQEDQLASSFGLAHDQDAVITHLLAVNPDSVRNNKGILESHDVTVFIPKNGKES